MRDEDAHDPSMMELVSELHDLADMVDDPDERKHVREAIAMAHDVQKPGVFGGVIKGYDRADAAEAFLGALLFGIPMFVEGGTADVGAVLAGDPAIHLGTVIGTVATVDGIVFVADIQDVRVTEPVLGVIPRRLLGGLGISYTTAAVVMTVWGGSSGPNLRSQLARSWQRQCRWLPALSFLTSFQGPEWFNNG